MENVEEKREKAKKLKRILDLVSCDHLEDAVYHLCMSDEKIKYFIVEEMATKSFVINKGETVTGLSDDELFEFATDSYLSLGHEKTASILIEHLSNLVNNNKP